MQSLIKRRNRRAQVGIVATIVLVMVGVVAVGVLGTIMFRFLQKPEIKAEISCLEMQLKKPVYFEKACYNESISELRADARRTIEDVPIGTLGFVIDFENGNSASWSCDSNCLDCSILDIGNRKSYYFDVSGLGQPNKISILADSCGIGSISIERC